MPSFGNRSFGVAVLVAAILAPALLLGIEALAEVGAQSSDPKILYGEALQLEGVLRKDLDAHRAGEPPDELLGRIRVLVASYRDLARLFPASGYSDNALWQGGQLAADAFWRFGDATDRATAVRLLKALVAGFPTSSLVKRVPAHVTKLEEAQPPQAVATPVPPPAPRETAPGVAAAAATATPAPPRAPQSILRAIRREVLPDALRFIIELEREVSFHDERLDGPPRVFVDLQNTRPTDELKDATLPFPDDLVRQIRIGRHADSRTRVVLDLTTASRHSVYTLYNPYRVVIDVERSAPASLAVNPVAASTPAVSGPAALAPEVPSAPREAAPIASPPPAAPSANTSGGFSLSRQLGLGIARVVIDPGHGGHDPGAKIKGLSEADLVLDVAQRLEKLLKKRPGVEVVLTRRSDVYLTLEERTAIANQSSADLFLSIHANANVNPAISGVETYFLNFAQSKEAEAIAARENAASAKSMHQLPDIVRAIALNNKIDESRDFARILQASLYDRLRKVNKTVKNLGVKQAPFVVLIGATMPSILAEIAFMTNRQEATLLKTEKYRQQIAEALEGGILRYQESLKKIPAVATQ